MQLCMHHEIFLKKERKIPLPGTQTQALLARRDGSREEISHHFDDLVLSAAGPHNI